MREILRNSLVVGAVVTLASLTFQIGPLLGCSLSPEKKTTTSRQIFMATSGTEKGEITKNAQIKKSAVQKSEKLKNKTDERQTCNRFD